MPEYLLECAVWELTLKCNLKCLHCGSSAGEKRKRELNTQEALSLCNDLKEAGCLSVALMGGEPFLREDFWIIAERIKQLKMDISVITNGTVFNESYFAKLAKLSPRAVAVSIDAAGKEIHEKIRGKAGCYEPAWAFIERALKENLPVSAITTVSKLNIGELKELSQQFLDKKIAWQIQTAGAEGDRFLKEYLLDEEEFYSVGIFIDWLRKNYSPDRLPVIGAHDLGYNSRFLSDLSLYGFWPGCQAGKTVIGIRSDGDILPCLALNNSAFAAGNALKRKIKDIWQDDAVFSEFRNFKKEDAGENCRACLKVEKCMGGCSEMSLMKTGRIRNNPYCFRAIEEKCAETFFDRLRLKAAEPKKEKRENLSLLGKIFKGYR